jgi:hypothetical protein
MASKNKAVKAEEVSGSSNAAVNAKGTKVGRRGHL